MSRMYLQLQRDVKIDKLSQDLYVEQTLEILAALRKLGDTLQPDEEAFLANHATDSLRLFEKVDQEQLGMLDALWFSSAMTLLLSYGDFSRWWPSWIFKNGGRSQMNPFVAMRGDKRLFVKISRSLVYILANDVLILVWWLD